MKHLKYLLLVGVAFSIMAGTGATAKFLEAGDVKGVWSATEKAQSHVNTGVKITKAMDMLSGLGKGWPVLDVTSVPAHAVVATEQEFIRLRTEIENEVKQKIKERISVKYLTDKTTGKPVTENGKKKEIDTKLSKVEIPSKDANKAVAGGIAGESKEMKAEGKKTTYELANTQQANWTSSAGTVETIEAYQRKRRYIEQEQLIRMLASASVLRAEVQDKLMCQSSGPMAKARQNFDASDAKKDLSEKEGKTVEKTNDYNQVLRQYAFNGLIYDQLLSLEQQVLGLRLQAKGGLNMQSADPITDELKVSGQDEAQQDAITGQGK